MLKVFFKITFKIPVLGDKISPIIAMTTTVEIKRGI